MNEDVRDTTEETPVPEGAPVVSEAVDEDESAFVLSDGPVVDGVQMPSEDLGPKTVEEDDPPVDVPGPSPEAEPETDESIPDCRDDEVDIEEDVAPPPAFDAKIAKKKGKRVWLVIRNLSEETLAGVFQISAAGKSIERELDIKPNVEAKIIVKSKKFVGYKGCVSVKFGKQIFEAE